MRVYFETYGCSANFNNTEIMEALLAKEGFEIVDEVEKADVIVLNTCIVKSPTETKMWRRLSLLSSLKKPLVVAGCMAEVYPKEITKKYHNVVLLGPRNLTDTVRAVRFALEKKQVNFIGKKRIVKSELPKIRKNKIINIIQISDGCLGNCSYCSVKLAKGGLFSYPMESIVEDVKHGLQDGCREVWITSQDNSAYGVDFSSSRSSKLPLLLNKISSIKGEFFVRVGMMNPNFVLPVLDDLIRSFESEKIFKFIHIPVQSGNNRILKLMNRQYNVEDFKLIVESFRKKFPKITLSTDIICGFPTETDEEFNDTLKLIKEVKPDVLNISKFWPRPYTKALKLKQTSGGIIKERSKTMTELFNKISLERNKLWLGWEGNALVDEYNEKNKTFIARNYAYKPIIIDNATTLKLGMMVRVRVNSVTNHDLRGVLV